MIWPASVASKIAWKNGPGGGGSFENKDRDANFANFHE
jgi:hypothetical protein